MSGKSTRFESISRRRFLQTTAATWAGIQFIANPERVFGANERVRVAVVGIRGRGGDHIQGYQKLPNVEVAAICDVDQNEIAKRLKQFKDRNWKEPKAFEDLRKLLEQPDIDAISIATPNHWHSLQGIWACQAGKDAYVEKPMSHRWFEGKQLVEAARKYKRIVMHGSQARCSPALREMVTKLREGLIGEVYMARGLCFKRRKSIGKTPPSEVPKGVNYDLWTGPAPLKPFTQNRFHYNWHWFWDYGSGDLGNQGLHEMDICRWGLGVAYPTRVSAMGGKYMFDDDQETPNTVVVTYDFGSGGKKKLLVFEVRHWITNDEAGIRGENVTGNVVGNIFYGSEGYLAIDTQARYQAYLGRKQEPGPSLRRGGNPYANFIQAVRSRKQSDLNAPIEEGAITSDLVHLGNISHRLGRSLRFDPKTLTVVGDSEANAMFTCEYRKPFVVPQKV